MIPALIEASQEQDEIVQEARLVCRIIGKQGAWFGIKAACGVSRLEELPDNYKLRVQILLIAILSIKLYS